jgi:phosphopantetheinyl transferase
MPLFFQQQVNAHTGLAIWKIEEDEGFFEVPLHRTITHPHKRLQHLAGRYLLKHLVPHFPVALIQLADTKKPYLEDELFHFSISHCGDFAAVIVSTHNRVGIDIETVSEKIGRIQHKFVSQAEMELFATLSGADAGITQNQEQPSPQYHQLTLIWSCKEAVFKWYGLGEVDFKKHMLLQHVETGDGKLFHTTMLFQKEGPQLIRLQSRFFENLCLSYVVT